MKRTLSVVLMLVLMCSVFTGCQSAAPALSSEAPAAVPEAPEATEIDWPDRAITVLVAGKGGDDGDHGARLFADYINKEFGVNTAVVYATNSSEACRKIRDSEPDGYTILYCKSNYIVDEVLGTVGDFSIFEDFIFTGTLCTNPASAITIDPKLGINTLQELYDYTQEHPNELCVTDNIGSNTQVTVKQLLNAGFKLTPVDVGGTTDKINSLLGGTTQVCIATYNSMKPYVDAGDMKYLCTVSEERNSFFPDIPTAKELGFEEVTLDTTFTLVMRQGTDPAIVEKFANFVKKVVESPEYAEEIGRAQSQVPMWMNGEDTVAYLREQCDMLHEIGFVE